MLRTVPPPPPSEPPLQPDALSAFDWSRRLSLDVIRNHTKTDDIPGVTDDQLSLYRAASLEAAEMYTGQLLSGQRNITEPIEGAAQTRMPQPIWDGYGYRNRMSYKHDLRYPSADGYVYLYGGPDPRDNRAFQVPIGARTIQVPIHTGCLDLSNCCDPCATHHDNSGMMSVYKAGYKCVDDVPAGIVLGCLQFLAWIVEHPGDELLTQRNRKDNSTKIGGVSGSNNIAMVSGELEQWRLYDESAI